MIGYDRRTGRWKYAYYSILTALCHLFAMTARHLCYCNAAKLMILLHPYYFLPLLLLFYERPTITKFLDLCLRNFAFFVWTKKNKIAERQCKVLHWNRSAARRRATSVQKYDAERLCTLWHIHCFDLLREPNKGSHFTASQHCTRWKKPFVNSALLRDNYTGIPTARRRTWYADGVLFLFHGREYYDRVQSLARIPHIACSFHRYHLPVTPPISPPPACRVPAPPPSLSLICPPIPLCLLISWEGIGQHTWCPCDTSATAWRPDWKPPRTCLSVCVIRGWSEERSYYCSFFVLYNHDLPPPRSPQTPSSLPARVLPRPALFLLASVAPHT